ncbi:hypothetical protein FHT82_004431 [Rhizobium sp. BK275]|uniref:hypothetical protein n=1 Tax=Rhizobium sp. BK275 TaxID=2587077 RepID=UPI00179761D4|nr:hypothetical protein [Rhizobium sp. BK275]MBB3391653.1 hypothetical protein [Rhizobium sp. BK275]
MPGASSARMQTGFHAIFILLVLCLRPAVGMPRCPPQNELLAKAKVVVEASVKSLFIGESGLIVTNEFPTRMIRADLEIRRVIKGEFAGKEVTVYGAMFPPGPYRELSLMALLAGYDGHDTFEWELSSYEIGDTGMSFFVMSDCIYYKFPDLITNPQ